MNHLLVEKMTALRAARRAATSVVVRSQVDAQIRLLNDLRRADMMAAADARRRAARAAA